MESVAKKVYHNNINHAVLALVPNDAHAILDVGCGAGVHAKELNGRGHRVDGVTLSEDEADLARVFCANVWIHDLEAGLPSGISSQYNCALCSHVLEHICWPDHLLDDLRRVLLPTNGLLIVALPNFIFVKQRLQILRGDFHYERSGLWDETHFRWYTFASGREMLESHGFEVIHASANGYCPLGPIRRIAPKLATKFDSWVCRVWPGLFGWQFLYVARPKKGASLAKK